MKTIPQELADKAQQFIATPAETGSVVLPLSNLPKVCVHPGCQSVLPVFDFGVHAGHQFTVPLCAYCDDHLPLYRPGTSKSLDSKIATHKSMWRNYSAYLPEQCPERVIQYVRPGAKTGITVDARQMIEIIAQQRKGCLLQGDTGLGKTYALYAISDFLLREDNQMPLVCYAPQLRNDLAHDATASDPSAKRDTLARLCGAYRLFIDDLGSASWTDSFEEAMKLVIEKRTSSGLPIFTSIQQTGNDFININNRQGSTHRRAAILRRLCEHCIIFKFTKP